jgi:hypothetical protein
MLKVSGPLTNNAIKLHGQPSVIALGAQGGVAHLTLNFTSTGCKTYEELLELPPMSRTSSSGLSVTRTTAMLYTTTRQEVTLVSSKYALVKLRNS